MWFGKGKVLVLQSHTSKNALLTQRNRPKKKKRMCKNLLSWTPIIEREQTSSTGDSSRTILIPKWLLLSRRDTKLSDRKNLLYSSEAETPPQLHKCPFSFHLEYFQTHQIKLFQVHQWNPRADFLKEKPRAVKCRGVNSARICNSLKHWPVAPVKAACPLSHKSSWCYNVRCLLTIIAHGGLIQWHKIWRIWGNNLGHIIILILLRNET